MKPSIYDVITAQHKPLIEAMQSVVPVSFKPFDTVIVENSIHNMDMNWSNYRMYINNQDSGDSLTIEVSFNDGKLSFSISFNSFNVANLENSSVRSMLTLFGTLE